MVLDTDYAGDMAILDNSRDGLQESIDLLAQAHYCSYTDFRINLKKIQCMAISRSATQSGRYGTAELSIDPNQDQDVQG